MVKPLNLASLFMLAAACGLGAQTPAPEKPPQGAINSQANWPQAKPADVDSPEHIVQALYDVISGPAHQPRDWNRMRSLFVPGARLIPVRIEPGTPNAKTNPNTDVILLGIDDYIARASARMEADGFFERSIHNETTQFGSLVSVWSTYESRHALDDQTPFARGINSIQLLKDGARYWIVDVYWDSERTESPIPAKYLPASAAGDPTRLNAGFAGEWTGQLEYRDYQSDEHVFLPTWLSAEATAEGRGVTFRYTYDDGPGKVVRESLLLTLLPETGTATMTSLTGDDRTTSTYDISGLEEFSKRDRGKLVLTGTGTDNNKPADVRITLTLYRNLLTWRKETRPKGTEEEFKFRDASTFTRSTPPL